jgi:putative transposase
MAKHSPSRYFKTSPEVIRLAVMLYVRFPLSLRGVEDLLHERGIDVSHETIRFWWNRFGLMFGTVLVHYRTIEHAPTIYYRRRLSSVGVG